MKTLLALCLLGFAALSTQAAEYLLICNPDTKAPALSKEEAKGLLLGTKPKWEDGTVVVLAVLTPCPVHEKVISELTARTPEQFDKYWKKLVFTGKAVMPEAMADENAMVAFVAKNKGALGYVSAAAKTDGVTVLTLK